MIHRKVLQLSIRGGSAQANLAQQPQTGAGAQHHGRWGHQVLPPRHDLLCWHGMPKEMSPFVPFGGVQWHFCMRRLSSNALNFCPSSPGKWGVQATDFPGLPALLQRLSASPGLYLPPPAREQRPAHLCWLEREGLRHWCQGSEAVRLLLGLQYSM